MKKTNLFFIFVFACGLSHMNHAMHKLSILQSNHIAALKKTEGDKSVKIYTDFDDLNFSQTPYEPVSKFNTRLINTAFIAMKIVDGVSTFMNHCNNAFSGDHTFINLSKRKAEDKKRKLCCYRCRKYIKKLSAEKKGIVKARL